jgi:hypothetical protein
MSVKRPWLFARGRGRCGGRGGAAGAEPAQEAAAQLEVTRIVAALGASVPVVVAGVSLLAECEEVNGQPGVLFIDREEPS